MVLSSLVLAQYVRHATKMVCLIVALSLSSSHSFADDKPDAKVSNPQKAQPAGQKKVQKKKKPPKKIQPLKYGSTLLFEPATGRVIKHHNANRRTYPASLTKLMTAYILFEAIEEGKLTQTLTLQSKLLFSKYSRSQPATRVGLKKGIDVTLDTAVRALIIRSANDFAVALAETISGSETKFIDRMNKTARRLGMSRTNFVNPHGLPNPHQVSTAHDLALLTSAIIRDFPQHADVFSTPQVSIRSLTLHTHNSLLRTFEGTDGMKTGFTCASGYNIIASATRNGRRLVVVIVGALTGADRNRRAKALLSEGFESLESANPTKANLTLVTLPVRQHKTYDTLDLSHKTRTWVCGNARKPRTTKKRRKRKKRRNRSAKKKKK